MDCFDTILAYKNMHTIFFTKSSSKNLPKNIIEIHVYAKLRLQFLYVPVFVNL